MVDWYNASWPYRKKITLTATHISGNQTNFPFLFRVSTPDTNFAANARTDGKDFIFTTSDGTTRTHHEIEFWQAGSGCIWVKAPTLTDDTSADFYVYYGEGTDHSQDTEYKPSGVWNNNYLGVYHLTGAVIGGIKDSTRNIKHAKSAGGTPIYEYHSGPIGGKCVGFSNASSEYIFLPRLFTNETNFSIECWSYHIDSNTLQTPFGNFWTTGGYVGFWWGMHTDDASDYQNAYIENGQQGGTFGGTVNKTRWIYWSFSQDTNSNSIYIDGVYQTGKTPPTQPTWGKISGCIGADGDYSTPASFMNGYVDEIRLSNTPRTAGYFKTTYSSMKAPTNFLTLYSQETNSTTITSFNTMSGSSIQWQWKPVTKNTGSAPRSPTANQLGWSWGTVTGDANTYIPSGGATWWGWCTEDK